MNQEDLKAELQKKSAPVPVKKGIQKPQLIKKPENKGPMKVMSGNPFDGANEMMMDQMGGEMNQGLDVMVNGEPMNDPQQVAEFVVNTPEVLNAVKTLLGGSEIKENEDENENDM